MDGFVNILKQLLTSKLTCAAVLFTATVAHFRPSVIDGIPPIPEEWRWAPFFIMLFTGFICAYWFVAGTLRFLGRRLRSSIAKDIAAKSPADLGPVERKLLGHIAGRSGRADMRLLDRNQFPDLIAANVALRLLMTRDLVELDGHEAILTAIGQLFVLDHRVDFPPNPAQDASNYFTF